MQYCRECKELNTPLIQYCTICNDHSIIGERMQRFSNNLFPKFSDEECITAYQWCKSKGRLTREYVYNFIHDYWHDWFPNFSSYQAFCSQQNNLVQAFQALAKLWLVILFANFENSVQYICRLLPNHPCETDSDWFRRSSQRILR